MAEVAPQSEVAVHPRGSYHGLPESPLETACLRPSPSSVRPHAKAKPQPQPTIAIYLRYDSLSLTLTEFL